MPEIVTLEPVTTAVVQGVVPLAGTAEFFDRSFGTLAAVLAEQGVAVAGPAFGLFHRPSGDVLDLEVGFPVAGPVEPRGDVVAGALPGGREVTWEVYVTEPSPDMDPADLRTELNWPVAP